MNVFIRIGLEETGPTSLDVKLNGDHFATLNESHANTVLDVQSTDTLEIVETPASAVETPESVVA